MTNPLPVGTFVKAVFQGVEFYGRIIEAYTDKNGYNPTYTISVTNENGGFVVMNNLTFPHIVSHIKPGILCN